MNGGDRHRASRGPLVWRWHILETFKKMDTRVQQGEGGSCPDGDKTVHPAEEKYGYIIPGEGGSVIGFKEKPDGHRRKIN